MKKIKLFVAVSLIGYISNAQIIYTVAGNGTAGYSGDASFAKSAELNSPAGVALDGFGNMYIADKNNNVIRIVNSAGIISTFAGNGTAGYSGDTGPATAAQLNGPFGVNVDAAGNVYIADCNNQRIRKVNTAGIISTFAGNGTNSFGGDGMLATAAEISNPESIAFDLSGNVYIYPTMGIIEYER